MLENIKLDTEYVRLQFPAFDDAVCKDWVFAENAGGSYVPRTVIDRLTHFMKSTKVQPYAEFDMSKMAGENMDKALNYFAKIINAKKNEILIGDSTSNNLYVLSNALGKSIKKGDEIIVTNQDHEANISPWRRLKEKGAIIKEWSFDKKDGELKLDKLKKLLSKKTKIVAVTHCSNIVGSVNNLKLIASIVHKYKAILIGDGVSYAPHGFPDVKELDVDFYTFSLYKTYGPHVALLYGREKILKKLPNQNHEFLNGMYPYTLNPGGANHEALASLIGIYEYFYKMYDHHFSNTKLGIRKKISKINELISQHEEDIANPILKYIDERKDLTLIGKNKISNKNRAPTIAFFSKKHSSKKISKIFVKNKIATRNDNFYAWRCLKNLDINPRDGVVRLSFTHYNTIEEVKKIIKVLDKI